MRNYLLAFLFIALFVIFHVTGVQINKTLEQPTSNFSPFLALFFCAAVYWKKSKLLLPLAIVSWIVVTLCVSPIQGYSPFNLDSLATVISYAMVVGFGWLLQKSPKPLFVLSGAFAGCVAFHLITNLVSYFTNPMYTADLNGLSQALWTTPPFPGAFPTAIFFRNLCASTLLFTALFLTSVHLPYFRKQTVNSLAHQAA